MIHDPDILHGLLINIHQPPCAVHQPQALICQPLFPVEGIKQPDAQLLFQLFHRHRQRRLRNRQILRRLGKAARLRQTIVLQRRPGLCGSLPELVIAGLQFLHTLDIGGQLIRRLHQLLCLRIRVQDQGVHRPEFLRQHMQQLLLRHGLHVLVRLADGGIIILDGGRHIAGQDLAGVVVQRRRRHGSGIHPAAEPLIADDRQRVRQHRHLMAVLLHVFRGGVPHQRPPLDEPHPGDIRKKVALHTGSSCISLNSASPSTAVIFTLRI